MKDIALLAAEGPLEILRQAGQLLAGLPGSRLIGEPSQGMYAMVHRDKVGRQDFIMGELLVTRAEAEVNGEIGFACLLGDQPERAGLAALIDAGIRSSHSGSAELATLIDRLADDAAARQAEHRNLVAATTVSFDVRPN